ncbi:uncharacterized protein LOC144432862 [Glandiceps talaboti]
MTLWHYNHDLLKQSQTREQFFSYVPKTSGLDLYEVHREVSIDLEMLAVWCFVCLAIFLCGNGVTVPSTNSSERLSSTATVKEEISVSGRPSDTTTQTTTKVLTSSRLEPSVTIMTESPDTVSSFDINLPSTMIISSLEETSRITSTVSPMLMSPGASSPAVTINDVKWISLDEESLLCLNPDSHVRMDSCNTPTGPICNSTIPPFADYQLCSCKSNCIGRGNCCYDYLDVCNHQNGLQDVVAGLEFCMKTKVDEEYIWTIQKCPRSWSSEDIRQKCENINETSMLGVTPVISPNGVVYRNIYCSICHGANMTTLQFAALEWNCPSSSKRLFRSHLSSIHSVLAMASSVHDCVRAVVIPDHIMTSLESCVYFINSCPVTSFDETAIKLCSNYTSYLTFGPGIYYRNIHCLQCNFESIDMSGHKCGIPLHVIELSRGPSFDILFDFNTMGDFHLDAAGLEFREHWDCPHGEIFDVIQEKCVTKGCPIDYVDIDGQCKPEIATLTPSLFTNLVSAYSQGPSLGYERGYQSDWLLSLLFAVPSKMAHDDLILLTYDIKNLIRKFFMNATHGLVLEELNMSKGTLFTLWAMGFRVVLEWNTMDHVFPEACRNILNLSESYMLGQNISLWSVSFEESGHGFCEDGVKQRLSIQTSTGITKAVIAEQISTLKGNSINPADFRLSKACSFQQKKVDDSCEVVFCSDNNTKDDKHLFNCSGLIVKIHATDFKISEGVLLVKLRTFQPGQFYLTGDGMHAYICNTDEQAFTIWNYNAKAKIKQVLTLIGCIISILCLFITLVTFCLFKKTRTRPGKILLNISVALMLGQVIFITLMDYSKYQVLCKTVAIFSHYIWLVAFCWMSVMAFDVMYTFRRKVVINSGENGKLLVQYCLFAWMVPFTVAGGCVLVNELAPTQYRIGYGEGPVCWIGRFVPLIITFLVPVGLLFIFNICSFAFSVYSMAKAESQMGKHRQQSYATRQVVFAIKMSIAMGLTWALGFVDSFVQSDVLDYVFILANTLQGMFIFVLFLLRVRTIDLYYNLCCKRRDL